MKKELNVPVVKSDPTIGTDPVNPDEVLIESVPFGGSGCPACHNGHWKISASHTLDRKTCRWWGIKPIIFECPACKKGYNKMAKLSQASGHSFRAGLSTMLQSLGFNREEIQSWGRWHSESYQAYLKDREARRATRARLTHTFGRILAAM